MWNPFKRTQRSEAPAASPVKRHHLRRLVRAMETHFSGANTDRLTSSWPAHPLSADEIVRLYQRQLVARSRQQCTENGYARAFLRLVRQNIVGATGFTIQAQVKKSDGTLDKAINDAIEVAVAEWSRPENCDVAGKKSWRQFELASAQGAAKDGEFMLRMVFGRDAGPYGFALQWLDPQRCPVDYDVAPARDGANFIRHGIEFNRYGRPVAFHFLTTDEGESQYTVGGRNYVRIPAEEIVHGFKDELGGQKRGLPWTATGLADLRHIGGTESAAVINARVGAAKMGVIEWEPGSEGPEFDEDDQLEIDAEAGTFPMLPQGAKLNKWDPQYPAGEFAVFMKHMARKVAAGWGVLYNNLVGDLEGVNFSSIRQGTLDERERWMEDQEWLAEVLHRRVIIGEWLPYALLSGRIRVNSQAISPSRLQQLSSAITFQGRRWTWIDPGADVKAAVDSKNNLLKSPSAIIRESARDPSQVYREIAQDIADMKAAGIPDEYIQLAFGQKLTPPATEKKPAP